MLRELEDCIEELCIHCGRYENEYEGACDGCRWYRIKSGEERKKYDETLMDCAEDIICGCNYCSCEDLEEDEEGREVATHTCPFFIDGSCGIGDPTTWDLGRRK